MIPAALSPLEMRSLALGLPAVALFALWRLRPPTPRARAGALQAGLWSFISLFALHVAAGRWGWWWFEAEGGTLEGLPIDLWIGWALAWGPLLALALPRASVIGIVAAVAAFDIALMPLLGPTVRLGPNWLVGETVAIVGCLIPGLLLARWTAEDRRLEARAAIQIVAFGMLMLVLAPVIAENATNRPWSIPLPAWRSIAWQLLVLPAVLGLAAVQEFVRRGGGTPVPWDPPKRLVTSGPYSYVANPMQIAAIACLALIGVARGSGWIMFSAVWSFFASVGVVAWTERVQMAHRFGEPWHHYRRHVRNWIPRWTPWHPSISEEKVAGGTLPDSRPAPARVYVAFGCAECSSVGRTIERMKPVGLEVHAAEAHPTRDLARITYDPMDGGPDVDGVDAIARVLEHVNLGLAFGGFVLRLPGVRRVVQAALDAAGFGPMPVARTSCAHPYGLGANEAKVRRRA